MLPNHEIPLEFLRAMPKGLHVVSKNGTQFILVNSLFCPNGHSLLDEHVYIHEEPAIKTKVQLLNNQGRLFTEGFLFIDSFWGSHTKLYSFTPPDTTGHTVDLAAYCPQCNCSLNVPYTCNIEGCTSTSAFTLTLPGGINQIHVCARLGCPGHSLHITDVSPECIQYVNDINFFGNGADEYLGGL